MIRTLAFFVVFAIVPAAHADPHKVIVLPLDGNADPALRTKLNASVDKLAHQIDGTVTTGDTTFTETAAAVGCDATTPACADTVMATLSVDEIVYGTATTTNGQTVVVVKRAAKGEPAKEAQATVAADTPDQVETGVGSLFPHREQPLTTTPPPPDVAWSRDKKIGIAATAGGGALLLIGLFLWNTASDYQSQIDKHDTDTPADFRDLTSLESSAAWRAGIGNFAVLFGLAGAGVGAYFLYRDYHAGSVTVTPTPVEHGAGVTIGGRW